VREGYEKQALELFDESLQLLDPSGHSPAQSWRVTFTSFVQAGDNPADFTWRGCRAEAPAGQTARRTGAEILNFARLPVPAGELAALARSGRRPTPAPTVSAARRRLALRREPGPPRVPRRDPPAAANHFGDAERDHPNAPVVPAEKRRTTLAWVSAAALLVGGALAAWYFAVAAGKVGPGFARRDSAPATETQSPSAGTDLTAAVAPFDTVRAHAGPPSPGVSGAEVPVLPDAILFVGEGGATIPVPPLPALEQLCDGLTAADPAFTPSDLQVLMGPALLKPRTGSAKEIPLNADLNAKRLWMESAPLSRAVIDFSRRFRQRMEPILMELSKDLLKQGCTIELRPVGEAIASVGAIRLVLVGSERVPPPLEASRAWLREEGTSALESLESPLRERIQEVVLPTGYEWDLRPFVVLTNKAVPIDLFARWPVTEVRPLPTADFVKLREFYTTRGHALRKDIERLQTRIENASVAPGAGPVFTPDFPLGRLLGSPTNAPEYSFRSFLKAFPEQRPSAHAFLEFVGAFLRVAEHRDLKNANDVQRSLGNPATRTNTLAQLEPLLAIVARVRGGAELEKAVPPEGYFLAGWEAFRTLDAHRGELESARASLSFCEERLAHLPAGLSRTAHISLMAQRGRDVVEILRFPEPPPQ
jgi:hypothetical protein